MRFALDYGARDKLSSKLSYGTVKTATVMINSSSICPVDAFIPHDVQSVCPGGVDHSCTDIHRLGEEKRVPVPSITIFTTIRKTKVEAFQLQGNRETWADVDGISNDRYYI